MKNNQTTRCLSVRVLDLALAFPISGRGSFKWKASSTFMQIAKRLMLRNIRTSSRSAHQQTKKFAEKKVSFYKYTFHWKILIRLMKSLVSEKCCYLVLVACSKTLFLIIFCHSEVVRHSEKDIPEP